MKTGLVLEGGAMRGMYTAGVLDTFMDNDIWADMAVGASAGAIFGVNYPSRQKGRAIRYNKRFNKDKNYMGILPYLKEGNVISKKYAYYDVPRRLDIFDDETYKNSGIPFYAVVTNIETGKAEYMQVKSVFDQMEVLRASGSMPILSRPVEINGKRYLDGAVADSIPFLWMKKQGCDKLIVILTRDRTYRKKAISRPLVVMFYRKYPNFVKRFLRRHTMYNNTRDRLDEWEKAGKAFVIRPSEPLIINGIEKDPDKLQQVYDMGVADAKKSMEALKAYLAE